MSNAQFPNLFAQYQSFLTPVVKANKLVVANLEKMFAFQSRALQSYVNLGLNQLKDAAEVTDPKSLQTFVASQLEAATVVRQKLLGDARTLADLNTGFKAEFDKLIQNSVTHVTGQVTKVTQETTDTAIKVVENEISRTA